MGIKRNIVDIGVFGSVIAGCLVIFYTNNNGLGSALIMLGFIMSIARRFFYEILKLMGL